MAPQNLSMDLHNLEFTANGEKSQLQVDDELMKGSFSENVKGDPAPSPSTYLLRSPRTRTETRNKKIFFTSLKSMAMDPFHLIQALLTPGRSAASCNEETLSSSFLILDGFLTISLGELTHSDMNQNPDNQEYDPLYRYNMHHDAIERWGARLETNLCLGKVCYEYRHDSEEEEEKCMSFSSTDDEDDCTLDANGSGTATPPHQSQAAILSQKLDLIPLVLEDSLSKDIRVMNNPDRHVPPSHKMVADCLKFQEYEEATRVYVDILEADQERYGEHDLVCAIDYHNIGVTNLLAGDLEAALNSFQQSVILKRKCLDQNDMAVADSLIEIGIILYKKGDMKLALLTFNEALEIYKKSNKNRNANKLAKTSCSDSIGRTYNNIGCVYYKMGDHDSALLYMQKSMVAQRNALGLNSKAESALLNYALTQANTGYLKCKFGQLDALAFLEESLLVLESVLGDDNTTVDNVRCNISFVKQA